MFDRLGLLCSLTQLIPVLFWFDLRGCRTAEHLPILLLSFCVKVWADIFWRWLIGISATILTTTQPSSFHTRHLFMGLGNNKCLLTTVATVVSSAGLWNRSSYCMPHQMGCCSTGPYHMCRLCSSCCTGPQCHMWWAVYQLHCDMQTLSFQEHNFCHGCCDKLRTLQWRGEVIPPAGSSLYESIEQCLH